MVNHTIYFRKENWDKFKDEPQKSELVNLLLSRHYDIFKVGTLVEEVPAEDINVVGNREMQGILEENTGYKVCKHGADPRYRKFAKNGKPCK